MERQLSVRLTGLAPIVLPVIAIAFARAMTYTEWAAANAWPAALLFAWIVADSLLLATIAQAKDKRPGLRAMLGAGAAASLVIVVGGAPPVREAILAMPPLMAAAALTVSAYAVWSMSIAARALASGASLEDAAGLVLPAKLVRFMGAEARVMRLALLGWRRKQDVPPGAEAFDYHRFLVPMIYALLTLQAIELGVMHFLLMQWNTTVAWIWFALGVAGALWVIGLAQGFRIHPVLLCEDGLRVRSGVLLDVFVPYGAIAGVVPSFGAEQVKAKDTLNQAVFSWPNVMLHLDRPVAVRPMIGAGREVRRIALRVDDSARFLEALSARCEAGWQEA